MLQKSRAKSLLGAFDRLQASDIAGYRHVLYNFYYKRLLVLPVYQYWSSGIFSHSSTCYFVSNFFVKMFTKMIIPSIICYLKILGDHRLLGITSDYQLYLWDISTQTCLVSETVKPALVNNSSISKIFFFSLHCTITHVNSLFKLTSNFLISWNQLFIHTETSASYC